MNETKLDEQAVKYAAQDVAEGRRMIGAARVETAALPKLEGVLADGEVINEPLVNNRTLSVEDLFARTRKRVKLTRGAFKGELRRAIRDGFVERRGGDIHLTDHGLGVLGAVFNTPDEG